MENERKVYKVLNPNMVSPHMNMIYELNKEYRCKNFCDNDLYVCAPGLYATDLEGIAQVYIGDYYTRVFECTAYGKEVKYQFDPYHRRHEYLRLDREIKQDEIFELALKEEPRVGYRLSKVLLPEFAKKVIPPDNYVFSEAFDINEVRILLKCWTFYTFLIKTESDKILANAKIDFNDKECYFNFSFLISTIFKTVDIIAAKKFSDVWLALHHNFDYVNYGIFRFKNDEYNIITDTSGFMSVYAASLFPQELKTRMNTIIDDYLKMENPEWKKEIPYTMFQTAETLADKSIVIGYKDIRDMTAYKVNQYLVRGMKEIQ
jgi:hypothetical protein